MSGYTSDDDIMRLAEVVKKLWFAGQLTVHGYSLGIHLCQRFKEYKTLRIVLTHKELSKFYVTFEGEVVAGPVSSFTPDYVEAMQRLQFTAGILSHYSEFELDKEGAYESHFTLDPTMSMDVDVTQDTPIFFRFDMAELEDAEKFASDCLDENLRKTCKERVLG